MLIKSNLQLRGKRGQLVSTALVLLSILLVGLSEEADAVDVCIIGAGPAGIQTAYSAESKGYTVAVFEKEDYVGGRTKTIEVGNAKRPYWLGAGLHGKLTSSSLTDLALKFKVPHLTLDYEITFVDKDGSSGKFLPPLVQFVAQAIQIVALRAKLGKYINGPEGYLSDYPTSLNQPMKAWLEENNLSIMSDFFWFIMTAFGYGSLNEVPAVYGLKYLPASVMVNLVLFLLEQQKSKVDFYPFQELLQKMADSLSGDIYLNSEITNVDYEASGTGSEITFSVNSNPASRVSCDKTIITFPPTTEAMELFIPPDSGGLEDLLEQVQTYSYYTILLDDSEGYFADDIRVTFVLPQPDIPTDPGVNLFYWKQQEFKSSSVTAYYLAPLGKSISNEQVLDESLASYGSVIGRTVDDSIVQSFDKWTYFPHASTESLNDGFFGKFQSLQGEYNQYYTGGLFNFDTVQESMEHAQYIIKKFF